MVSVDVKIYDDFEQGSEAWFEARLGMVTASTIGSLITAKTMKLANNETARGNLATLAAERITGFVEDTYTSWAMQRGIELEEYARAEYSKHYAPVEEVAFIVRDIGGAKVGASPDGLVGDDGGIEIKTRIPKIHIATILADEVPAANMAQLQTFLFVTDREWIDYVSYSPGLHLWTKRVTPDPAWQSMIATAAEHAEQQISQLMASYALATEGLPLTERVELLEELELKL